MTDLKVVQLPVLDLRQIPAGLRKLADRIEKGKVSAEAALVIVQKAGGGNPDLFPFGPDLTDLKIVGLAQLGVLAAGRICTYTGRDASAGD